MSDLSTAASRTAGPLTCRCTSLPHPPHPPPSSSSGFRVIVLVGLVPLVALQPVALAFPSSWVSLHVGAFINYYTIEVPALSTIALLVILGAHSGSAALRATRAVRVRLEDHALQTQALLEAAMPPAVARSLLEDVPPEALARTFPGATIAFVLLEDYAAKARGPPGELMAWLDCVYSAFDALVDAYEERVNKIEIVRAADGARIVAYGVALHFPSPPQSGRQHVPSQHGPADRVARPREHHGRLLARPHCALREPARGGPSLCAHRTALRPCHRRHHRQVAPLLPRLRGHGCVRAGDRRRRRREERGGWLSPPAPASLPPHQSTWPRA